VVIGTPEVAGVIDVAPFGLAILLASAAVLAAVLANRLTEFIRLPAPALFLLIAALASDVFPDLGSLSVVTDERIVTVALIFILFDGGMQIGWGPFRDSAAATLWVGVVGTLVTASVLAAGAHLLFGFGWRNALLLGTALAPTDPAMVFSVLGGREVTGRTGTILKGESGVNDPVGIALMAVLLSAGEPGWDSVLQGLGTFVLQMAIGLVVGILGGRVLVRLMRSFPLPNEALYPVRVLAMAGVIYGVSDALHGSGFLAVLMAGVLVGDVRAPYKREIERFASALGSLAEIVAFTVLGLTIDLGELVSSSAVWTGLGIAVFLILVVRPLFVGPLLIKLDLNPGEKVFVLWAGLKGAVPILLGLFALAEGGPGAGTLYDVVFVVVLVSAAVQGGLVPLMAHALGVPMRPVELEPWSLGVRFQSEPRGVHRHFVGRGSPADGCALADLDLGEDAWISLVSRAGRLVEVHGGTTLLPGDEVLAVGRPDARLDHLFEARPMED
jgi:cell volume regulation protein A